MLDDDVSGKRSLQNAGLGLLVVSKFRVSVPLLQQILI